MALLALWADQALRSLYALYAGISLLSLLTSGFDNKRATRDVCGEVVEGEIRDVVLNTVHEYGVCGLSVANGLHAV